MKIHTIDTLNIVLFREIQETGDLQKLGDGSKKELNEAWEGINDGITAIIGANQDYIRLLQAKRREIAYLEEARAGDRFKLTLAEIEAREAEAILKELAKPGANLIEDLMQLSKMQGYHLKKEELSVREYYTLVKIANGQVKK